MRDVTDPLARRGARPANHAGDAQRPLDAGNRPHRCGTSSSCRAVGTEQTEDLAALNVETNMIHGREGAELADQVAHLHRRAVAIPLKRSRQRHRADGFPRRTRPMQQHHEAVFEPRQCCGNRCAGKYLVVLRPTTVFESNKTNLAARGHGIDDIRAIQELRLKFPSLSAGCWIGKKHATGGQPADIAWPSRRQHFTAVHDDHLAAALRFIEIEVPPAHQLLFIDKL